MNMKLSLEQLASIKEADTQEFLRITNTNLRSLENYVGGLLNQYRGTARSLCDKFGDKSIPSTKENVAILTYLEHNIELLCTIKHNFNLFVNPAARNVPITLTSAKRLLAAYNNDNDGREYDDE
jgi:hypothetical protein